MVTKDAAPRLSRPPRTGHRGDALEPVLAAAVACAGLALLAVAVAPYVGARGAYHAGDHLALALAGCVPVALLRRWALWVFWVLVGVTAVVLAHGTPPLPLGLLLGVATYLAASRLDRQTSITAVLAAVVAIGAGLLYAAIAFPRPPVVLEAVETVLPLAAAWFVGDAVAARRHYVAGLLEQTERERTAEAERAWLEVREERVRIARELHDVVAHTLAVMTVQAGVGRRLMAKRPEAAASALESIEAVGRTAQDELRVVLGLLRDEEPTAAALSPAPGLRDLDELVDTVRASGTPVDLRTWGLPANGRISAALELSIYRVVQEALTNVVKHAPGARATVGLALTAGSVRLEVADDGGAPDGAALDVDGPRSATGHGIVGMRERIGAFGGWLVAGPVRGHGFKVVAEVPIEAGA